MGEEVKMTYMALSNNWGAFINIYDRWDHEFINNTDKNFLSRYYTLDTLWYCDLLDRELARIAVCK